MGGCRFVLFQEMGDSRIHRIGISHHIDGHIFVKSVQDFLRSFANRVDFRIAQVNFCQIFGKLSHNHIKQDQGGHRN